LLREDEDELKLSFSILEIVLKMPSEISERLELG